MATEKYPNQNVNMPMEQSAIDGARARLAPGLSSSGDVFRPEPKDGKGSRREVRKGEWFDDRRIEIGGPSSPSEESPPELNMRAAPPEAYDPAKVYSIVLGKSAVFAGRTLSPGKQYMMAGYACTEVAASVVDAVEMGDIPADPNVAPSDAEPPQQPTRRGWRG